MAQQLRDKLEVLIPDHEISLALAEGPFEDSDGVGAHFEAAVLGGPEQLSICSCPREGGAAVGGDRLHLGAVGVPPFGHGNSRDL